MLFLLLLLSAKNKQVLGNLNRPGLGAVGSPLTQGFWPHLEEKPAALKMGRTVKALA